jgi:uncharacterized protein (TIGR03067 family)
MQQLQGTWAYIAPLSNCGERKSITFSGNRYVCIEADGTKNSGTFKFVNLTGNPKSIDWDWDDHEGFMAYGIFEIDGNTLYMIGHQDSEARPTDFTALPGRFGHVYKRVKEQK